MSSENYNLLYEAKKKHPPAVCRRAGFLFLFRWGQKIGHVVLIYLLTSKPTGCGTADSSKMHGHAAIRSTLWLPMAWYLSEYPTT